MKDDFGGLSANKILDEFAKTTLENYADVIQKLDPKDFDGDPKNWFVLFAATSFAIFDSLLSHPIDVANAMKKSEKKSIQLFGQMMCECLHNSLKLSTQSISKKIDGNLDD